MRKYSLYMVFVMGLTLLFNGQTAFSQTAEEFKAQQKDISAIKEGQIQLQKDLQEIKKLLQAKPAAAPGGDFKEAIINIKGAPIRGDKNAKLVLMEFTEYQ